jgi:hypothetical protein
MKVLRFQLASSILSLAGVVAWSACGESYGDGTETPLPDRNFKDDSGAETSTGESDKDAGGIDDRDAALAKDGDAAIDAAGCCDCDGDGYLRESCLTTKDITIVDCDDSDFRRHPKADFSFELASGKLSHSGDWDCSGVVEKKIAINLDCGNKVGTACAGVGFASDPACGVQADLIQCEATLSLCTAKVVTTGARQSCK